MRTRSVSAPARVRCAVCSDASQTSITTTAADHVLLSLPALINHHTQTHTRAHTHKQTNNAGKVRRREFATPAEPVSLLGGAGELLASLAGILSGSPRFTDNASVSLQRVGGDSDNGNGGDNGGRRLVLAMSETPAASYVLDADTLDTLRRVAYTDGVKGDLMTAHPTRLPDGSLLNFSRSLPFGGYHVFKQVVFFLCVCVFICAFFCF